MRPFAFLVLLFLTLRLGTLLTSVEYVSWYEERYRGTIAKELIEGLKAPLWDYQADHYDGGSLWVGVLAVPVFLLFGQNLFALKLVGLLFSLGALVLTFLLFKKFFDRKTALLASVLLVFPPPVFTALSLTANGSHPESVFFTSAMLFFFYQFLYGEKNKRLFLILFGLVAGLGFWFTSITFITTLTCLISWVLIDRHSFLSKRVFIFLGAFLVGLLPFILYNATHHFRFLWFLAGAFLWKVRGDNSLIEEFVSTLGEKLISVPLRVSALIFKTLPLLFRFRPCLGISDQLLTLLYGIAAWFLISLFIGREGRKFFPLLKNSLRKGKAPPDLLKNARSLPFLIFPILFILIFSVTNYPTFPFLPEKFNEFKYFSPLYYFLFSLLALALRSQKKSALFLTILLTLGLVGQGSLLFNEPVGKALRYRGYSYSLLGTTWGMYLHRFPKKFNESVSLASRFEDSERRFLYWGLSNVMAILKIVKDPEITWEAIRDIPQDYRRYFLENWGRHLSVFRKEDLNRNIELGRLIPEEERSYFYYGLAAKIPLGVPHRLELEGVCAPSLERLDASHPKLFHHFEYFEFGRLLYCSMEQKGWKEGAIEIPDSLGKEEKTWVYRGIGAEAAVSWFWSINFKWTFEALVAKLPQEAQPEFYWGFGWGLRGEDMIEDPLRTLDWFHRIPREAQPWAWQGFQAFEKWYGITATK